MLGIQAAFAQQLAGRPGGTDEKELDVRPSRGRQNRSVNDHRRPRVAAEKVDGNAHDSVRAVLGSRRCDWPDQ